MLPLLLLACQTSPSPTTPATDPGSQPVTAAVTGVEGARLNRLSHVQWQNTVVDLLHLDGTVDLTEHFVDSAVPTWFENDRDALDIDPTLWLQYQSAAETLSAQVVSDDELLAAVAPIRDRDAFVAAFGHRAFRRPLTSAELATYGTLFDQGPGIFGSDDPFADGVHVVIAAMLQSPWFLYRGLGYAGPGDGTELEDHELAAKLSYSLWNTMPDDELFAAAAAGLTPEVVQAQARRLLEHPRGRAMVADLHRQWLDIDRYENVYRTDEERYDDYEKSTPYAMTLEVYAFVDRIVFGGGTVQDLLSSRETLVEDRLASVYGVPGVQGLDNTSMQWVSLDPSERAGLFTLTGWLALQSDGNTEDLIHRGAYINHAVLCVDVPAPAESVPPLPVDETQERTLRERIEAHTIPCGGACHEDYINPVGFAFAQYDAAGAFQTERNGLSLDASGSFDLDAGEVSWNTGVEFLEQLAVSPQVHRCYLDHLLTYAEGRRTSGPADEARLDDLMVRSLDGEPILELLYAMVTDEAYRQRP